MRHHGTIPYDSFALVSNEWMNEWLTSLVSLVWVVGAVRLAITEPGFGDAGFLVVTVKLPYVAQDGFWVAWREGGKRDRKDAAWGDGSEQVDHMFRQKHVHLNMSVSGEKWLFLIFFRGRCSKWMWEALTSEKRSLLYHQWKAWSWMKC